mmetsp:Transcript_98939/g.220884  ORF Transcript_98939/g.220884 Transcript_98939/m.220884 type:complete len:221 (-) Transcript_98939:5-667(-)
MVNLLPGRPTETMTMVAPLARFLRRFCASGVGFASSSGGTFASIWYVAVGSKERIASSRACADIGCGKLPGEATSCSTSNLDRCRSEPLLSGARHAGMSVSICAARLPLISSCSKTISKSPPAGGLDPGDARGAGEAQSVGPIDLLGGEGIQEPEFRRCKFKASSNECTFEDGGELSGESPGEDPRRPLKQPPQQLHLNVAIASLRPGCTGGGMARDPQG